MTQGMGNSQDAGGELGTKAISFDFWNTLFTEAPDGYKFYGGRRQQLLEAALSGYETITPERISKASHVEARIHHRIWVEQHRTLTTRDRIIVILGALDAALPLERVDELTSAFEEGILDRPPIPVDGALDVIAQLHGKYRLGIISDTGFSPGRVLRRVLDQAGLLRAFDSLVFSDEAGRSKPHALVFKRTAAALATRIDEIAHVGDLEHTDIVGAKNAGCYAVRFVGVTPMGEGESTVADKVVHSLSEISPAVEKF